MGLATGLAVGSMIAGGVTKAVAAKKKATAAKEAAAMQEKATRSAQGISRESLSNLNSLYAPFLRSGASGTLGRLTTPGAGARYASPGPTPTQLPPPPGGGPPGQAVPRGGPPPGAAGLWGNQQGGESGGMPYGNWGGQQMPSMGPPQGGVFARMQQMGQGRPPQPPPPGQFQY